MVCVVAVIPQSMRGAAIGRSAGQQGAAAYIAAVQWPTGIIAGATSTVRLYSADRVICTLLQVDSDRLLALVERLDLHESLRLDIRD